MSEANDSDDLKTSAAFQEEHVIDEKGMDEDSTRNAGVEEKKKDEQISNEEAKLFINQNVSNFDKSQNQRITQQVNVYASQENERIEFRQMSRLEFRNLTESEANFISSSISSIITELKRSRVLVINEDSNISFAQAAIQNLIANIPLQDAGGPICTTMSSQTNVALWNIIRKFKESEYYKEGIEQTLIVYEERRDSNLTGEFIGHLVRRGGAADSDSAHLKRLALTVIFVCRDIEYFRTIALADAQFSYLDFSILKIKIFQIQGNFEQTNLIYSQIETAIRKYGWLKDLEMSDKVHRIQNLIRLGQIENELLSFKSEFESKNHEEQLRELLKNPLNNIILFVVSFFDSLGIRDLEELVRRLIQGSQNKADESSADESSSRRMMSRWEDDGDDLLAQCGIYLIPASKTNAAYYKHEFEYRKVLARRIFFRRPQILYKRFEILKQLLLKPHVNKSILTGLISIAFKNAENESTHYLTDICIEITTHIEFVGGNDFERHQLFMHLKQFLVASQQNEVTKSFSNDFYDKMTQTEDRRITLSILFAYMCNAVSHEYFSKCRILLDRLSNNEFQWGYLMMEQVSSNYGQDITRILNEIDTWESESSIGVKSRSYALAKCSLLFIFNADLGAKINDKKTDYYILSEVLKDKSLSAYKSLARHLFENKTWQSFQKLYQKDYINAGIADGQNQRNMNTDLKIFMAVALIQWNQIVNQIIENNNDLNLKRDEIFFPVFEVLAQEKKSEDIVIGIKKVREWITVQIHYLQERNAETDAIKRMKAKRDDAFKILEQIKLN